MTNAMTNTTTKPTNWGVIDAGIGGLTVLSAMRRKQPHGTFVYYGDCRNMPYNIHPVEWIRDKAQRLLDEVAPRVSQVAIACNTISTMAERLDGRNAPLFDVVAPTQRWLSEMVSEGLLVIIGTATTVAARVYEEVGPRVEVARVPCPMLATTIERYGSDAQEVRDCAEREIGAGLARQKATNVTALIACTHYSLIRPIIEEIVCGRVGDDVRFVDAGQIFVDSLDLRTAGQGLSPTNRGQVDISLNLDSDDIRARHMQALLRRLDLEDALLNAINI